LVIVEGSCVDVPEGMLNQPRVDNDRCIAGLATPADAVHGSSAAAGIQLSHDFSGEIP